MTRVVVLGLGGTIAMVAPDGGGAITPALDVADLLKALPHLSARGLELDSETLLNAPSASLTLRDVRRAAEAARRHIADGADGVVITQGTDTLEESAFALDLLWNSSAPLVVTGAMRAASDVGADGPANLLAAVITAASPQARDRGCLVAVAEQLHAARWVAKTHATSPAAFASPLAGPVGYLLEETPHFFAPASRPPRPALPADIPPSGATPRVALLTVTLGDDTTLLEAIDERFAGLIIAGVGAGHTPASWVAPLERIAARIPVVLTTRVGVGSIASNTYGYPGSESDLLARGLISGGALDAYKARLLLMLLLESGVERAAISEAFTGRPGGDVVPQSG
jgi:L-asparaginase